MRSPRASRCRRGSTAASGTQTESTRRPAGIWACAAVRLPTSPTWWQQASWSSRMRHAGRSKATGRGVDVRPGSGGCPATRPSSKPLRNRTMGERQAKESGLSQTFFHESGLQESVWGDPPQDEDIGRHVQRGDRAQAQAPSRTPRPLGRRLVGHASRIASASLSRTRALDDRAHVAAWERKGSIRSRCVRSRRALPHPPSGRTASSSSATRGRQSVGRARASPRSTDTP